MFLPQRDGHLFGAFILPFFRNGYFSQKSIVTYNLPHVTSILIPKMSKSAVIGNGGGHVASVSKQITVMCILLLQEDGKLHIEDDVRKYVNEYINFEESVTIRQLMNNVSGIRDQWELLDLCGVRIVDTITQRDVLSLISRQEHLNFQPQSEMLYSNSNFTLLAEIVERISDKTLNEFATERIFKPLGMDSTFFKENYWKVIPRRANSYYDDGSGHFVYSVLNYGTYGATSLNTTAADFLKWFENFKQPVICSHETVDLMSETRKLMDGTENSYAGGLFVGEYKGHRYIQHGGADAAYRSATMRFPDDDIDIIIFSNTQNILMKDAVLAVADAVFKYEENKRGEEQPIEYRDENNIEGVEGYYLLSSDSMFMTFHISNIGGIPYMKNSYGEAPLVHISGNHFKVEQLNLDLYLGKNSVVKTKGNLIPLKKLKPFQPTESSIYKGKYESRELDTSYHVIEKEGSLHLSHSRNGDQALYQIGDHKFVINVFFPYIVEFLIKGGEVEGITFIGSRIKNVKAVKVTK